MAVEQFAKQMTIETRIKSGLHGVDMIMLLTICLVVFGKMTFGLGLGDLIPILSLGIYTLANTVLTIFINDKRFLKTLLVVSIAVLCWTVWGVTIGRGTEYEWNGNVFLP